MPQKTRKRLFSLAKQVQLTMELFLFNNLPVMRKNILKNLGLLYNFKINFADHIIEKLKKTLKGLNITRKKNFLLPRYSPRFYYFLRCQNNLPFAQSL